ncbi:MAG: pyridoxal phosphate-dependent aminotransferase [Phycisphaerae bacterium]|nr:pyridoxal phosphate-dependent aminotransferase [Phycisphaerae bacterium]
MRRNIVHEGSGQLKYEIREIVAVADELHKLGREIIWENIGDPLAKGEPMPTWIKDIIGELVKEDKTYGYVATQGVLEAREFIAKEVNARGGCQIASDDILFFNGLGDAVAKVYGFLRREARVLGPSPAYSTHSSAEAAHSGYEHLTYELDANNNWLPDLEDIENKIKYNDSIAGLILINPDNPTGAVYPKEILEEIVDICRRYGVFIICDEIYANIVYKENGQHAYLSEVIGDDVAGLALRGISKEYPWPGGRCGWVEVYNKDKYPQFKTYFNTLLSSKMVEVCSTSLPQYSIPKVMGDPRYAVHLKERAAMFGRRAKEAWETLSKVPGITVNKPEGAFYMSILFDEGVLNSKQKLDIDNEEIKRYIEAKVHGVADDKRFVYYLLAAYGICVVPMTGFCCAKKGFRVTLLECNDEKRLYTWDTIAKAITDYLGSV